MVDKVITIGRTRETAILRGRGTPSAPIGGDFREIKFTCRFSADAVNSAPNKPHIRVDVSTTTPEYLYQVEIVPPGGNQEVLRRSGRGSAHSWARRVVVEDGRPQVAPRPSTRRAIGDLGWEWDDPFGEIGDEEVAPDDPGGGGGFGGGGLGGGSGGTYTRYLDPASDEGGTWTVRVRNNSQNEERFFITVNHPETVQDLRETRIPFQLINRAFAQTLLTMQLSMKIDNGQASIAFDPAFRDLTGIENQVISVNDRLEDINLETFTVELVSEESVNGGRIPTICAGLDLEERKTELDLPFHDVDVENLAIMCRIMFSFSYPKDLVYSDDRDFFDTAMKRENGQVLRQSMLLSTYLDVHPHIHDLWASILNLVVDLFGPSFGEMMQSAIDDAQYSLAGQIRKAEPYVQDVIMHLVDRDDVMFSIGADEDSIVVLHHPRPSFRDFLDEDDVFSPDDPVVVGAGTRATPDDVRVGDAETTATFGDRAVAAGMRPPGAARVARENVSLRTVEELSALTASAGSTAPQLREGEIDHIVILMMENRSFDHMLGYRAFSHPEVNGLTGYESNPFSQGAPYYVFHLSKTAGIRSPIHGFEATLEQLADGKMSGFVQNYSKRVNVDPGVVMGYYDARELPMYEFLANNFAVCDAWHSAHVGETQCNRFATLTGIIPELDNFELSDQRMGYYNGATVLDYLTQRDVDWVYAEGNVGFLRMFDRYRIDVSHVIPYRDDFNQGIEDTFVQRVADGNLPSVSFIDPRFIDIPPAWDANDDLPPADVCRGQHLIRDVYSRLSKTSTWPRTLLLVTYDEHGGFYDHETPLGMPTSRDPSPFPRLHPEGPEHLGVRVPAFVVSPWVDGGTVFHTTYDHTSILKTILQRFAPADFPVAETFGPRAAAANGLLTEKLRTSARKTPLEAPEFPECETNGPRGPSADIDSTDFQLSMRLLGVPAKYRERTVW